MEDNNKKLYRNLVILLKIFKNRPNHLAKYLIDNLAFDDDFIEKIISSSKLNDIKDDFDHDYFPEMIDHDIPYFSTYEEMDEYYNNIIIQDFKKSQDPKGVEIDLNDKLNNLIQDENYEEAARLRDYMKRNDININ